MLHALSGLSSKELARVKQLVNSWIRAFWKSGIQDEREPSVFKYRTFNLWCPLLKDGQCTVYDRRPTACRMHVAIDDAHKCEDDKLREHQIFAVIPELQNFVFEKSLHDMKDGESDYYDHFGVMLYEHFFGIDSPTMARVKVSLSSDKLTVEKYEDDNHEQKRS